MALSTDQRERISNVLSFFLSPRFWDELCERLGT
jgi:hypothetical protein